MERETGIEPALVAWKATVLPLNYSRPGGTSLLQLANLVEGGGLLRASCPPPLRAIPLRGMLESLLRFLRTCISFGGSNPPHGPSIRKTNFGGGRWIRTTEGMSQQIYSLPPLAAWVSLRNSVQLPAETRKTGTYTGSRSINNLSVRAEPHIVCGR